MNAKGPNSSRLDTDTNLALPADQLRVTRDFGNLTILGDEARDSFVEMLSNEPQASKALIATLNINSVSL